MNAAHLRRKSPATAAVKPDISPASAPMLPAEAPLEVWAADTLPVGEEEVRSATNAAKSATSLATALMAVLEVTEAGAADTAEEVMAADTEDAHSRLATLAVAMDTCLVTAPKAKSAIIVSRVVVPPRTR